jgi:hypothetical protein
MAIKFNLVQNARDSLEHAIEHLVSDHGAKAGNLKKVMRDLSHVVELILKERLARVHPAFVFTKVEAFGDRGAHTVTTDSAIKRLCAVAGVKFTKSDSRTIDACKNLRNQVEHFEFEIEEKEAEAVAGRVLTFILAFSENELDLDWKQELVQNDNWPKLYSLSEFWSNHYKLTLEALEKYEDAILDCPSCRSDAFLPEEQVCRVCGHSEEPSECSMCHEPFLDSSASDPELGLCDPCVYADGYAAANFEKY